MAIDANAPRLFDFLTMNVGMDRRICTVRREVLQNTVGGRRTVMVRIPFNFTPAENQVEALLDELMSMGYRITSMATPAVGMHCMIYTLHLN